MHPYPIAVLTKQYNAEARISAATILANLYLIDIYDGHHENDVYDIVTKPIDALRSNKVLFTSANAIHTIIKPAT